MPCLPAAGRPEIVESRASAAGRTGSRPSRAIPDPGRPNPGRIYVFLSSATLIVSPSEARRLTS